MSTDLSPDTPANRRLFLAVQANRPERVARTLAEGASTEVRIQNGAAQPLLCRALARGKTKAVVALLEGGADPAWTGPDGRDACALAILVRQGDAAMVVDWLSRFPSLHAPAPLLQALVHTPPQTHTVFDVVYRAARTLPAELWSEQRAPLGEAIEHLATPGCLHRMEKLALLDPGLKGHPSMTQALLRAIEHNWVEVGRWLLNHQGANPHVPARPSNDHTPPRTAHEQALRYNRPGMIALWRKGDALDDTAWSRDIAVAVEHQARTVFDTLWNDARLATSDKQARVRALCVEVRHRPDPLDSTLKKGRRVSAIEAACWGQTEARIPAWVARLVRLECASSEQMGKALHALFERTRLLPRLGGEHLTKALQQLNDAGADWGQSDAQGRTAEEAGRAHPHWGDLVAAWRAQAQARDLDASLSLAGREPRRLRL